VTIIKTSDGIIGERNARLPGDGDCQTVIETKRGSLEEKEASLRRLLRECESVLIALSGGVDSAYLAYVASSELGSRSLAVTGYSASYPGFQSRLAARLVSEFGIRHEVIATSEFDDPNYTQNPANRCYFCKSELYSKLSQLAGQRGLNVVCDGTNADDVGDYRPGRAAAGELGVRSPLLECGLTKLEIRDLARRAGLPAWNEPASACLSSRIPYGQMVTIEKVSMVDKAEEALKQIGFRQVRVRHHGDVARIEIAPDELPRALDLDVFGRMAAALKAIGFKYVTLDLEGYRTGSLNDSLRT
jgi:pyridinium-3,5-biscarboxylic acid mononucleotide sulfurtransferase